ncbi:MAG: hypothetical protein IKD95_02215, partial [Bacteroidales bacterium]|nr:hypothetical protein [Bacteroidales bacterium]
MKKDIRYNGQTAALSDYDSPDGDLALSLGVIKDRGALRPVPGPTEVSAAHNIPHREVIHVHKTTKFTHKIILQRYNPGGKLYWAATLGAGLSDFQELYTFGQTTVTDVSSVGNTLVVLTNAGVFYFLWKEESETYATLGSNLPEISLSFSLHGELVESDYHEFAFAENIPSEDAQASWERNVDLSDANSAVITSAVMSTVNKFIADHATNAGKFIMPFFVRYALRLFDGTLVHHSAPIFMPCASDVT